MKFIRTERDEGVTMVSNLELIRRDGFRVAAGSSAATHRKSASYTLIIRGSVGESGHHGP